MATTGTLVLNVPAKINLFLHVTARRGDGYHDLSSLVVFTEFGDRLHVAPADAGNLELDISGPFASQVPLDDGNLVIRAARRAAREILDAGARSNFGARIALEKNIPVAAGLGGGSSDAAVTLIALNRIWQLGFSDQNLQQLGSGLGADVPACIAGVPSWVRGIGDRLTPVSGIPELPLLLVNPGIQLSTPKVFQGLKAIPSLPEPVAPDAFADAHAVADFLRTCRNDLEVPAIELVPEIGEALALLEGQPECLLARMSGSGATLFALFPNRAAVARAAVSVRSARPKWWVTETRVPG